VAILFGNFGTNRQREEPQRHKGRKEIKIGEPQRTRRAQRKAEERRTKRKARQRKDHEVTKDAKKSRRE
jgi:hypothetical protein